VTSVISDFLLQKEILLSSKQLLALSCQKIKLDGITSIQMEVQPRELLGLTSPDLCEFLESVGEKPFRGRQIYHSIYRLRQFRLDHFTNLSLSLRRKLEQLSCITLPAVHTSQLSVDGTRKYLFQLTDGEKIESVLIPEAARNTLCISTQVGCPMDCQFCLTALVGFARNLTAGEIVGQILYIFCDQLKTNGDSGPKTTNVVLMGMGEPLLNLQNVTKALSLMADPAGMGIPSHRITLSTVGLVPKILELARAPVVPNLAISLSATTDEVRNKLMPVNRKYRIAELISACRQFPLAPRQRITFEYVLIDGVNDSDGDARRLVQLLSGLRAKVNLLPLNPGQTNGMRPSPPNRVLRFQQILTTKSVATYIRTPRGSDIFAACGQLHRAVRPQGPSC
jgi:23S rRNA (adenine2503-C2)-methyltransferase